MTCLLKCDTKRLMPTSVECEITNILKYRPESVNWLVANVLNIFRGFFGSLWLNSLFLYFPIFWNFFQFTGFSSFRNIGTVLIMYLIIFQILLLYFLNLIFNFSVMRIVNLLYYFNFLWEIFSWNIQNLP